MVLTAHHPPPENFPLTPETYVRMAPELHLRLLRRLPFLMSRHRNLHRCLTCLAIAGVCLSLQAQKQKKKKGAEPPPPALPQFIAIDRLAPGPWTSFPLANVLPPPDPIKELLSKVKAPYT